MFFCFYYIDAFAFIVYLKYMLLDLTGYEVRMAMQSSDCLNVFTCVVPFQNVDMLCYSIWYCIHVYNHNRKCIMAIFKNNSIVNKSAHIFEYAIPLQQSLKILLWSMSKPGPMLNKLEWSATVVASSVETTWRVLLLTFFSFHVSFLLCYRSNLPPHSTKDSLRKMFNFIDFHRLASYKRQRQVALHSNTYSTA